MASRTSSTRYLWTQDTLEWREALTIWFQYCVVLLTYVGALVGFVGGGVFGHQTTSARKSRHCEPLVTEISGRIGREEFFEKM